MAATADHSTSHNDPSLAWMQAWSYWLRRNGTLRALPEPGSSAYLVMTEAARVLAAHRLFAPRFDPRAGLLSAELCHALAAEADAALADHGYSHNGKWNARVGPVAESLLDVVDLPAVIAGASGVRVAQPHTATYIGYRSQGEFLDFHVDALGFGDVNLIACLTHDAAAGDSVSETVFVTPDGYLRCPAQPGAAMLFDGAFTPHGRTPVASGERVILLSLGFYATDVDRINQLDQVPFPPDGERRGPDPGDQLTIREAEVSAYDD